MLVKQLILLTLFLSHFMLATVSQTNENNYMDLLVLLVDENYEKCLKKSIKLTENQDSRKEALPYLYASMAYFEMSRDNKFITDYPKAFNSSISYLGKYRKKDPSFQYKEDAQGYIEKIKFILAEDIENNKLMYKEKAPKKNKGTYKKIAKMDPNDRSIVVLQGIAEYESMSKSEGRRTLKESVPYLDSVAVEKEFEKLTESQQYFYKKALIAYAKFEIESNPAHAKRMLAIGKKYYIDQNDLCLLTDNTDFKRAYKKLTKN